jgi:uncharacterized repeat protein (TIGR03803 family)
MKLSKPFLCPSVFALIVFLTCTAVVSPAATEKILHSFNAYPYGINPVGGVVRDSAGNLYGVTGAGGAYSNGTVFEMQPNSHGGWTKKVLYSFKGGLDGSAPNPVILDSAGNLYGTTLTGGVVCTENKHHARSGLSSVDHLIGEVSFVDGCGTVFELSPSPSGNWTKTVLYNFGQYKGDGIYPAGALVLDTAGNLYGTTKDGGIGGFLFAGGTVFELMPLSGGKWTETVLHAFDAKTSDGVGPVGSLTLDQAGNVYGTTGGGGGQCISQGGCGTVFELSPASGGPWTETILYAFTGAPDGNNPSGGVTLDTAGNLYGVTDLGGTCTSPGFNFGCGIVFELSRGANGHWTESILYDFQSGNDGSEPESNLIFDNAGNLYGSTYDGGGVGKCSDGGCGTVFELSPNGIGQWTETVLWRFGASGDGNPSSGVIIDPTGALYGTTYNVDLITPGANGTVFKLVQTKGQWQVSNVADFPTVEAHNPTAALVSDSAGNFYGASAGGTHDLGTIFELSPGLGGQWTEKLLYSFQMGAHYGAVSPLVFDGSGNLYGEMASLGASNLGLVYKLSPSSSGTWTETDLYSFPGGASGAKPTGGLIFDSSGNLYGTAAEQGHYGQGVVFELTPGSDGSWTETVLHSFRAFPVDGINPQGGLVFDQAGNLYGTTQQGGQYAKGAIFELSPSMGGGWTETAAYSFAGGSDGQSPNAGLVVDSSGNVYGTTYLGGSGCPYSGCGTAFKLSAGRGHDRTETVLFAFTDVGNGYYPSSGLIFDSSGNLYGTTSDPCIAVKLKTWCGTVYELSPLGGGTWSETVLHGFKPTGNDGSSPYGGLAMGVDGGLYGTTSVGGAANQGVVFEVIP